MLIFLTFCWNCMVYYKKSIHVYIRNFEKFLEQWHAIYRWKAFNYLILNMYCLLKYSNKWKSYWRKHFFVIIQFNTRSHCTKMFITSEQVEIFQQVIPPWSRICILYPTNHNSPSELDRWKKYRGWGSPPHPQYFFYLSSSDELLWLSG